jgi:acyl carrier protein
MKTEAMLIQVLENVIGVRNLNRDTRFLDIGGNSLNLVEVLKQLKEKVGVAPPPRLFFDKSQSTIAALSAAIDTLREDSRMAASAAD